jgi:hypothetical protein
MKQRDWELHQEMQNLQITLFNEWMYEKNEQIKEMKFEFYEKIRAWRERASDAYFDKKHYQI